MNLRLQEIRKKLYLLRDGASSASMRKKGLHYKINFGVPVTALKKLAGEYTPDSELANEMWGKNSRELNILATLIQDPSTFIYAEKWVNDIQSVELAEQAVMNLFCKISENQRYASEWIQSDKFYVRLSGFLLYIRLFMQNYKMNAEEEKIYFFSLFNTMNEESLILKNAAFNSLKYLGKQSDNYLKLISEKIKESNQLNEEIKEYLIEELFFDVEG